LVGAGADETVLRSIAPGAGLLIDADGDVAVSDLTLRHEGTASASVVIVTAGGFDLQGLTLTGGVSAESGAGGFGLILRSSDNPLRAAGSLQRVTDVRLFDHDGGGIFVGSDATPSIDDVVVEQSGGCGLCFVENAAGTVRSLVVQAVPIGVRVDDEAAPLLSDLSIRDTSIGVALTGTGSPGITQSRVLGARTGFEVVGSGSPRLRDVTVSDSVDIAVRLAEATKASVRGLEINGSTTVGIGVTDNAAPTLTSLTISTSGDVGILWAGDASGSARQLRLVSSRLAIQISDSAAPDVADVVVDAAREAALLASGSSAGQVTRLTCPAGTPVALLETTTTRVSDSPTCTIADER
jgi:hypothetical protein